MTVEPKILVSRSAMAEWLGISRAALEKHRGAWVMVGNRLDLAATTAGYCEALRKAAAQRSDEDQIRSLAFERSRLAKERADEMQIRNATRREGLISATDAATVWADFLRHLRFQLLTIPGRAQAAAGLTQAQAAVIEREVRAALLPTEGHSGERPRH